MPWVIIALSSAAIAGANSILDKMVLVRYIRSPLTLPCLLGLMMGGVGVILIPVLSWPEESTFSSISWSLLSGVFLGVGSLLVFHVLFTQEVSRTSPILNTHPIYAALIAVIFLDERLTTYHWLAIMATVTGAILLSVRQDQQYRGLFLHPSLYILMMAGVLFAGGNVANKIALEDLPILNAHGLRSLGLGVVLLFGSLRPVAMREIRDLLRQRSPALVIIGLNALVLATIIMLMTNWALSLGPVSLVSTLLGTRSLFVVLYSITLTLRFSGFLGEQVSAGVVAVKVVSTALIVGGVATITLI